MFWRWLCKVVDDLCSTLGSNCAFVDGAYFTLTKNRLTWQSLLLWLPFLDGKMGPFVKEKCGRPVRKRGNQRSIRPRFAAQLRQEQLEGQQAGELLGESGRES